MGFVDTRLTLFAIITAIEQDLRSVILEHLWPQLSRSKVLFGCELYEKCARRFVDENTAEPVDTAANELIVFSDLGDLFQVLNSHRALLPEHIGKHIRESTTGFDSLVSMRNRVMHIRPLRFEDLPQTLLLANRIVSAQSLPWPKTKDVLQRLEREPHFVLGLKMPAEDSGPAGHNLPSPDFDETGFLGRSEEIDRLASLIRGPFPVITIVGVGGVGKTALALKVAYDFLDSDPDRFDAVVWSSSKTTQLTTTDVCAVRDGITDSLGLIKAVATELVGGKLLDPVAELLEFMSEFRVLVFLDNLETVLDERVRNFLGQLPNGSKVVITSRVGVGAYEHPVKLGPLKSEESIQLLHALAQSRDVTSLVKTNNSQLKIYCVRLQNNPGFIKWFVSSVQAGVRPEDALASPDTFLDFCMTNVYRYLSVNARHLLGCMTIVGEKLSQAELAFLSEFEPLSIQQSLQELIAANMIVMTSVPQEGSYQSQYHLDPLTLRYLNKHHPVSNEAFQNVLGRKRKLASLREAEHATKRDPFSAYTISTRSRNDLIVAKYLQDALQRIKREDWVEADAFIEKARQLSPDYFEVHRIEARKYYEQKNMPAARISYEAALELNPESAPLRLWYGGFLLRIDETSDAYEQLSAGLRLAPSAIPLLIELARVELYLRRFADATNRLRVCVGMSSKLVGERHLRKAWDLLLQVHRRKAEGAFTETDNYEALGSCVAFRETYDECPRWLIDQRVKSQLDHILRIADGLQKLLTDEALRAKASDVVAWCEAEADRTIEQPSLVEGETHGFVKQIHAAEKYGFIELEDGRSIFFHFAYLVDAVLWGILCPGVEVSFTLTQSEKGLEARQVKLVGTGGVQSRYGIVKNVLPRFGFIRTESGAELFFHRNSMMRPSDWNRIDAGVRVQFEMGVNAKGPVAEKVQLRE